jgi:hypothetical protein
VGTRSAKKAPEMIEGKTGVLEPPPRKIDLSNLKDVRLEMAAVYRRVDREEIPSQEGSRRVYMLRQIADVITSAELERRLIELEAMQQTRSLPAGLPVLLERSVN